MLQICETLEVSPVRVYLCILSHLCTLSQVKPYMIHFQIQTVAEMKEFHVKEPVYIFFYEIKEMSECCKSVKNYKLQSF